MKTLFETYKEAILNAQTMGELLELGGKIWTHSPDELTNAEQVELDLLRSKRIGELKGAETNEQKKERIIKELDDLLQESGLNFSDYLQESDLDDVRDADDLYNSHIERAINESSDIIYYSRAMDYLQENDASLTRSLELASEYGYSLEDLNSEKLASILNYQENVDAYRKNKGEIDDLLDEWHEIEHSPHFAGVLLWVKKSSEAIYRAVLTVLYCRWVQLPLLPPLWINKKRPIKTN